MFLNSPKMAMKLSRVIKIWTDCLCYHVQTAQTQEDKILRKWNPSSAHQSLLCCELGTVMSDSKPAAPQLCEDSERIMILEMLWYMCSFRSSAQYNKFTWTIFSFFMWHLRGQIRLFCVSSSGSICWAVELGVVLTYLTKHAKYSPRSSAKGCFMF